jgi:hypothetical protein
MRNKAFAIGIIVLMCFAFIGCYYDYDPTPDTPIDSNNNSSNNNNNSNNNTPASYVIVTKTGSSFHRSGCGTIKNSKNTTSMSREQAIAKGYSACGTCKP